MLNNVLETKVVEFASLEQAEKSLALKDWQQVIVPASSLSVTEDGLLQSEGSSINGYVHARLTDFSLKTLHELLRIPHAYAQRLEPPLHRANINELLKKRVSSVTVTVESDREKPLNSQHYVVAVLPSQPMAIPHQVILNHLLEKDLVGRVILAPGYLEAHLATHDEIEVLPQDVFSVEAMIINSQLGLRRWPFEISCFLTRLVCANGAITRRQLLPSRIPLWTQNPKTLSEYIDRQLHAVTEEALLGLQKAVDKMITVLMCKEAQESLRFHVRRAAGVKFLEGLFEKARSAYDHLNEITALANKLEDRERKRRLWILGGEMLAGYFN